MGDTLTSGEIAGIIVGVVVGILLIVFIVSFAVPRRATVYRPSPRTDFVNFGGVRIRL